MKKLSRQALSEDKCFLCEKFFVDGVETGQWAYDTTCAVCVEKQAKYEGLDPRSIYKPDDSDTHLAFSRLELELVVLGAMAKKLCAKSNIPTPEKGG